LADPCYHALAVAWYRSQIGNRRHYSIERLLAFRDYCDRVSSVRVAAVCLLYPVPAFLVLFLLECIPLRDPTEGWKANWALWVRMFVSALFIGAGILFQFKAAIEVGVISNARIIGSVVTAAAYYTGLSVVLAAAWRFPIPFGLVVNVCPFEVVVNGLFVLCIGLRVVRQNAKLRKQLLAHLSVASTQLLLVVVYPIFSSIFIRLSPLQQAMFVMVLPTLKFALKQAIARASTHLEERVGSLIVFNVDVFNVLYVAMCMQSAQSILTVVLLISSDVFHIVLALRTIYFQTHAIHEYRERASSVWKLRHPINCLEGMPAMVRAAFDEPPPPVPAHTEPVRVFAPYKLSVSDDSMAFLQELVLKRPEQATAAASEAASRIESGPTMKVITAESHRSNSALGGGTMGPSPLSLGPRSPSLIQKSSANPVWVNNRQDPGDCPAPNRPTVVKRAPSTRTKSMSSRSISHASSHSLLANLRRASFVPLGADPLALEARSTEEAVRQGLQALFHCEYVILAEYVECALPLMYAVYLAGLYHLPTAAYYPHTRDLSPEKLQSTLIQLLLYSSLEFASLLGLFFMLKRRFGFSPLYQLAFVLETEAATLQSLLFPWVIFTLQLTLLHYGACARFAFDRACGPLH
jgi:hypothetical protein